jgi:hypothetical protein
MNSTLHLLAYDAELRRRLLQATHLHRPLTRSGRRSGAAARGPGRAR